MLVFPADRGLRGTAASLPTEACEALQLSIPSTLPWFFSASSTEPMYLADT